MISYGRDPYNHDCTVLERVMNKRMLEAMNHVWQKCVVEGPRPEFIFVHDDFYDAWQEAVTKGDLPWFRGHEFLPYG